VGHVTSEMRNTCNILVIKHEGKRPRLKWEHSDSSLSIATRPGAEQSEFKG
jgi:hypothetical protein